MSQLTPKEQYEQFVKENQLIFPYYNLRQSGLNGPVYSYRPDVIMYPECKEGWYELIIGMFEELIDAGWNKQVAVIKQKWGYLEVYTTIPYRTLTEPQQEIIDRYQQLAKNTCEITGTTEDLGWWGDGWITLMCREEAKKKCELAGTNLQDCWTQEHPLKVWAAKREEQ